MKLRTPVNTFNDRKHQEENVLPEQTGVFIPTKDLQQRSINTEVDVFKKHELLFSFPHQQIYWNIFFIQISRLPDPKSTQLFFLS